MMNLVSSTDKILTTPCSKFEFDNPPFDPVVFSQELVKTMYDNNGLGISANQVGSPYQILAMRGDPENFVCFNPKLLTVSNEEIVLEETSLSYPGLIVKVKRPQHIRVRFAAPNGEIMTKQFTGLTARTFQQQLDFLSGIVYYNRANRYHRDKALRNWRNK